MHAIWTKFSVGISWHFLLTTSAAKYCDISSDGGGDDDDDHHHHHGGGGGDGDGDSNDDDGDSSEGDNINKCFNCQINIKLFASC